MKTLVVTSQKGGSGKSTLTRNLGVAAGEDGRSVLLLDLDPQQTLRGWWASREAEAPAMLDRDPSPELLPRVLAGAAKRFDLVVIDTPPAAPEWLREVLRLADLALVPVRPSPDDLRAVGATLRACRETGTGFAFVMSQAPRARLTEEAARTLAQHGRVAPVNIAARVVYAETGASGLGATEAAAGDAKAADEVRTLWGYVRGLLDDGQEADRA